MGQGIDREQLRELVRETVERHGYEFVDLELRGGGKGATLRVFIDKPAGISHEDCHLISDQVGAVLDVEDALPWSYTLEVSSPGIERKLYKPEDYQRFQGKLARVQTRLALNSQRVFHGRLQGLENGKVRLASPKGEVVEIPLDVVQEARLEFDWAEERQHLKQSERGVSQDV